MFTKIGYLLNMCFNVFIKMRNFRIPADCYQRKFWESC